MGVTVMDKPVIEDAKKIADIINSTDTKDRGTLLYVVSLFLEDCTQYFTSKVILRAAIAYGYDNKVVKGDSDEKIRNRS